MASKSNCSRCVLIGFVAFLLLGYLLNPFGGGKGPTTSSKVQAPTGEVVSYDTYYVQAFQDPGRDYLFYYQSNPSSPREQMDGIFQGPGDPIPLKKVTVYCFTDRMILIVDTFIFGKPDSYVFFHALPYEKGAWQILYNKRDNFKVFDRIESEGQVLVEDGTSLSDDHVHDFVYDVTSTGQLEEKRLRPEVVPK